MSQTTRLPLARPAAADPDRALRMSQARPRLLGPARQARPTRNRHGRPRRVPSRVQLGRRGRRVRLCPRRPEDGRHHVSRRGRRVSLSLPALRCAAPRCDRCLTAAMSVRFPHAAASSEVRCRLLASASDITFSDTDQASACCALQPAQPSMAGFSLRTSSRRVPLQPGRILQWPQRLT
jgi:hypothetical protein